MTCHKLGKKGHLQKYCSSKGTRYIGKPPKKSKNDLTSWFTNNPVVLDTKDLSTSPMTCKNKKYRWCTSCNNGNGSWVFHCKYGHYEWENKQENKSYVCFSDTTNNVIIYCSFLMTTSDNSTEEEEEGRYDSQDTVSSPG